MYFHLKLILIVLETLHTLFGALVLPVNVGERGLHIFQVIQRLIRFKLKIVSRCIVNHFKSAQA